MNGMGRLRGQRMGVLGEKVAELQELNYLLSLRSFC